MKFFDLYQEVSNRIRGYDYHFVRTVDRFIKDYFNGRKLTGIEVSVGDYNHVNSVIRFLNLDRLYVVNPLSVHDVDANRVLFSRLKDVYKVVCVVDRVKDWNLNQLVDFVYLNGISLKDDLGFFYPFVRPGGVFGGYIPSVLQVDVLKVLFSFVEEHGLVLDGDKNSWWVIKK